MDNRNLSLLASSTRFFLYDLSYAVLSSYGETLKQGRDYSTIRGLPGVSTLLQGG